MLMDWGVFPHSVHVLKELSELRSLSFRVVWFSVVLRSLPAL